MKHLIDILQHLKTWVDLTFVDLSRQFHLSFLPPLMVYFAAGLSGITSIVGAFFVKEYLDLSAALLAGLTFWAGLPWTLKIPLGHIIDIFWRWKELLIYVGAAFITISMLIMYALISIPDELAIIMSINSWFILSLLLAPCGYVIQDAVADAMSVDAVPRFDETGRALSKEREKSLHTTMQTLGRVALISGFIAVALLNIFMFEGVESLDAQAKANIYARIYLAGLAIPLISISGVLLFSFLKHTRRKKMAALGKGSKELAAIFKKPGKPTKPNYWYFAGGFLYVCLALVIGLTDIPFSQEIVFLGSITIVVFLMTHLVDQLDPVQAKTLFGTAIIIFVFRAVPLPGPGAVWFEIDRLGFDQQFISVLTFITSLLTLVGMLILRPFMASKSITYIIITLTLITSVLSLPNIGLYYGLHHWTSELTGGIVDARFIAIIDTAIESPFGQVAMIPMLAWIARNAPPNLKATFFAVMASFTNLALSASSLLTKYLNEVFLISREVRNRETGALEMVANYDELGTLLIIVTVIALLAPLLAILLIQRSPLRIAD